MAQFNPKTQELDFDYQDLDAAWNNAPFLENKNSDQFRLCYICKFHLERKLFAGVTSDEFGWTIDLINAKKPELIFSNYIAVHQNCVPNRSKMDARKTLKIIKTTKWSFDEDFWNN